MPRANKKSAPQKTKEPPERISLKGLARHLGISAATVREAERAGKYLRGPDGLFDLAEVMEARAAIDPVLQKAGYRGASMSSGKRYEQGDLDVDEGEEIDAHSPKSLAQAKTKEAIWKAERAELIYKRDSGLLLDREVVESSIESMATTIQMKIKNLAPKLRPHMSDAGKEILERELDGVLNEMASDIMRMVPDVED